MLELVQEQSYNFTLKPVYNLCHKGCLKVGGLHYRHVLHINHKQN